MVPKNMQNLVLLVEPSEDASEISLKGGNMCLNRFSIDEDAAFELSGVFYFENFENWYEKARGTLTQNKRSLFILITFIRVNNFEFP